MHSPAIHISELVLESPSSQSVPSTAFVSSLHTPVVGTHAPATLQADDGASQVMPSHRSMPTHSPKLQASSRVVTSPSSQAVPSGAFVSAPQSPSVQMPATLQTPVACGHVTPAHRSARTQLCTTSVMYAIAGWPSAACGSVCGCSSWSVDRTGSTHDCPETASRRIKVKRSRLHEQSAKGSPFVLLWSVTLAT